MVAELPGQRWRGSCAGSVSATSCALSLPKLVFFFEWPDGAWLTDSESYLLCSFLLCSDFAVTEAQFAIFVFCFVMSFQFSSHALLAIVYFFIFFYNLAAFVLNGGREGEGKSLGKGFLDGSKGKRAGVSVLLYPAHPCPLTVGKHEGLNLGRTPSCNSGAGQVPA